MQREPTCNSVPTFHYKCVLFITYNIGNMRINNSAYTKFLV